MCFSGGGGANSGPPMQYYVPTGGGVMDRVYAEQGIPQSYFDRGARTVAQYQLMAQQDLSDKQLTAQKAIADQQDAFNQQQFQYQQDQQNQQLAQAQAQADRQNTYDTGRADLLAKGSQQINDAFAQFSPDYFKQYQVDYMNKATGDIDYQQQLAQKQMLFGLARQGISNSQSRADQQGLLDEDAGRATAEQTQNALDASNQLQTQVGQAKTNLLGQVQSSEALAPPIAGGNDAAVQAALQTQGNAITGIAGNSGNTIAGLNAVPSVSPIANIFGNVLGAIGAGNAGSNQALAAATYANNSRGANGPGKDSTTTANARP